MRLTIDLCVPKTIENAPAGDVRIVHSLPGRLRVHLGHWSGTRGDEIGDLICRLYGVTFAEARAITRNVLIRFEPSQTTAETLLSALPALRLDPLPLAPIEDASGQALDSERPAVVYMTGAGRVLYQALGWASVGMAVVGAILPGIPTAPFVVLAGYFFIRSSREAHEWLRSSRWFGPMLRDWEEHRAIRRSLRNAALGLIFAGMVITLLLGLPTALTVSIVTMQIIGMAIILSLPVIETPQLRLLQASVEA